MSADKEKLKRRPSLLASERKPVSVLALFFDPTKRRDSLKDSTPNSSDAESISEARGEVCYNFFVSLQLTSKTFVTLRPKTLKNSAWKSNSKSKRTRTNGRKKQFKFS